MEPDQSIQNLPRLIFTCIVTMLFLACVNIARSIFLTFFEQSNHYFIGLLLLEINYIVGPLGLITLPYLFQLLYYRFIFFITALANIIFLLFGMVVIYCDSSDRSLCYYQFPIMIILSVLTAPFNSIFFSTYNYYVDKLSGIQNKGAYFGLAYSMMRFSSATIIGSFLAAFLDPLIQNDFLFYLVFVLSAFVVSNFYWLIKENNKKKQKKKNMNEVLMDSTKLKIDKKQKEKQKQKSKFSLKKQLNELWNTLNLNDFSYLLPNLFQIGVIQVKIILNFKFKGFFIISMRSVVQVAILNEDLEQLFSLTTKTYVFYGIGQFLGGFCAGVLSDFHSKVDCLIYIQILTYISFLQAVFLNIYQFELAIRSKTLNLFINQFICNFYWVCQFCSNSINLQLLCIYILSIILLNNFQNQYVLTLCNCLYCYGFAITILIFEILSYWSNLINAYVSIGFVLLLTTINVIFLWIYKKRKISSSSISTIN